MIPGLERIFLGRRFSFPADTVRLRTADNVEIVAYHHRGHRDAAVVIAHSLGSCAHRRSLGRLADRLRPVADPLLVDLRGHGASGGVVDGREWLDLSACAAYARDSGYGRVHLVGFSLGALAALKLVAEERCAASVTAISPLGPKDTLNRAVMLYGSWVGRVATRLHGGRLARPGQARAADFPLGQDLAPAMARTPLLVVGTERDFLFTNRDAEAVYAAAPEPKALLLLPGRRHGPLVLEGFEGRVTEAILGHITSVEKAHQPDS